MSACLSHSAPNTLMPLFLCSTVLFLVPWTSQAPFQLLKPFTCFSSCLMSFNLMPSTFTFSNDSCFMSLRLHSAYWSLYGLSQSSSQEVLHISFSLFQCILLFPSYTSSQFEMIYFVHFFFFIVSLLYYNVSSMRKVYCHLLPYPLGSAQTLAQS